MTTFVLAGRYFEARAKRRAGAALTALLELGAKDVAVLDPDGERAARPGRAARRRRSLRRPPRREGRHRRRRRGRAAARSTSRCSPASPSRSRSSPATRSPARPSTPAAASIVRATRVGADTALAQIARLVTEAQSGKAPVQRLADRVSGIFVPIVIGLAAATLGFWLGAGESAEFAFTAAVAVLIIACPCALGLATPTALLVGTGRGAQLGLLIKGPEVLESTRRVDTIVLDKTGTVTTGRMSLVDVVLADGRRARRRPAARRRARGRLRAPDRPRDRRGGARRAPGRAARGRALRQPRGARRRGHRRRPRRPGRPARR